MTKDALSELWRQLGVRRASRGAPGFRMRQVEGKATLRCFAALSDPGAERALLIELPLDLPRARFAGYSTRSFNVDFGRVDGLPPGAFALMITLKEPVFAELFELLATDISEQVLSASSASEGASAAVAVLDRWRGFLQRRSSLLTREEVRGLIGELVILARLLSHLGPRQAVEAWRGPIGGVRDFETDELLVETKSFAPAAGASVHISDPLQLEGSPSVRVRLACVALDVAESGATLAEFAATVMGLLSGDPGLAQLFEQRLAAAGFLHSMAGVLPERYVAHEPRVFEVGPDFPRIRPADVPQGVRGVRFLIELGSLGPFVVPADASVGHRPSSPEATILP